MPGNGVLLHPHLEQPEAVDDVLAGQLDEDGPIDRQIELVGGDDVVLGVGVGANEAERIVGGDARDFAAAEPAVRARIVRVPLELLRR